MQFQPYLMFDGTCAEAMKFYERVIGGKLEAMLKYSEMPEPCADMPAGSGDRIAHACLVSGVTLTFPTPDAARNVFDALAEGGQVTMPLGKTFWAEAFGMLTDRFGAHWLVNGGMTAS